MLGMFAGGKKVRVPFQRFYSQGIEPRGLIFSVRDHDSVGCVEMHRVT